MLGGVSGLKKTGSATLNPVHGMEIKQSGPPPVPPLPKRPPALIAMTPMKKTANAPSVPSKFCQNCFDIFPIQSKY